MSSCEDLTKFGRLLLGLRFNFTDNVFMSRHKPLTYLCRMMQYAYRVPYLCKNFCLVKVENGMAYKIT